MPKYYIRFNARIYILKKKQKKKTIWPLFNLIDLINRQFNNSLLKNHRWITKCTADRFDQNPFRLFCCNSKNNNSMEVWRDWWCWPVIGFSILKMKNRFLWTLNTFGHSVQFRKCVVFFLVNGFRKLMWSYFITC